MAVIPPIIPSILLYNRIREEEAEAEEAEEAELERARQKLREARRKKDEAFNKSDNETGYRYYSPAKLMSIEFEDIKDDTTRKFVEDFFAYRQSKIDKDNAEIKASIANMQKEIAKYEEIEAPLTEREDRAKKILRDCFDKVESKNYISYGYGDDVTIRILGEKLFQKTVKRLVTEEPFFQIRLISKGDGFYTTLNFDLEALRGIPFEQSNYRKRLDETKMDFENGLLSMQEKLENLQNKFKRAIRPSKRKDLKIQIEKLSTDIKEQQEERSSIDKIISGYRDFYNNVASLNKNNLNAITTAISEVQSNKKRDAHFAKEGLKTKVSALNKQLSNQDMSRYNNLVSEYVSTHPEYTAEALEHIETGIRTAEKQKRDAVHKETRVYSTNPTSIAHEIKTDDVCRMLKRARDKIKIASEESEKE